MLTISTTPQIQVFQKESSGKQESINCEFKEQTNFPSKAEGSSLINKQKPIFKTYQEIHGHKQKINSICAFPYIDQKVLDELHAAKNK